MKISGFFFIQKTPPCDCGNSDTTFLPKTGTSYNAAASAILRQWITDERRYYVSHFVSAWNYAIE